MMSLSAATPIVTPTVTPTVAQTARRANNCDDSKSTCPRLAIASRLPALTRLAVANSQRMAGQLRDWSLVKLAIDQQSQRPSLLGLIADPPIPTIRAINPPVGEEASDCCYQQSNQSIGPTSDGHGWSGWECCWACCWHCCRTNRRDQSRPCRCSLSRSLNRHEGVTRAAFIKRAKP
jgi:hypothetical protein